MSDTKTSPESTIVSEVSEAPSSSSEESDCEPEPEPETDVVNIEWAMHILAKTGVREMTEVEVCTKDGVTGSLSKVLAVAISYKDRERQEITVPVILKLPPRDPFGRLFVAEAQFDTREVLFYTKLAPVLNEIAKELGPDAGLNIPKCIKAKLPQRIGEDSELVLEDVNADGYESAPFVEGLTEKRARAAIRSAARLHALSLALQDRRGPLDEQFDFLFPCERAAAGYLRLIRRGLPQLEEFLRGREDCREEATAVSALCARAPSLLDTLLRPVNPAPLIHADFWCANLLFRDHDGESDCKILDWQMISLGRPMDDIALLLLSSLSPAMRRCLGDELIDYYGDCLMKECVVLGAESSGGELRDGLRADWPRAALRAMLLCAGSVDIALDDPRAEERMLEAVRDLHAEGILALKPIADTE